MGHSKLFIGEMENGKQPLVNDAGNLFMFGNNELHNSETIRSTRSGVAFTTGLDNMEESITAEEFMHERNKVEPPLLTREELA